MLVFQCLYFSVSISVLVFQCLYFSVCISVLVFQCLYFSVSFSVLVFHLGFSFIVVIYVNHLKSFQNQIIEKELYF